MPMILQAARGSAAVDEINDVKPPPVEEDHAKITTYEKAFRKIKEATGVSDTQVRQIFRCKLFGINFISSCLKYK